MNIEDKLAAINARIKERMADIEQRVNRPPLAFSPDRTAREAGTKSEGAEKRMGLGSADLLFPPSGFPPSRRRDIGVKKAASAGRRYGLFVGVNNAIGQNQLDGCVADAEGLAKACVELGGWRPEDIKVLRDGEGTVKATREALRAMAGKAVAGDVVIFSVSCHGGCDKTRPQDNDSDICLYDGPYWEADLRSDLMAFRSGVGVVVFADICHADGLYQQKGSGFDLKAFFSPSRFPPRANGGISQEEIGWMLSSKKEQSSADGVAGGYFTVVVLKGWRAGGAVGFASEVSPGEMGAEGLQAALEPSDGVKYVTFLDLALFSAHSWRYNSRNQQPQYHNPDVLRRIVAGRIE